MSEKKCTLTDAELRDAVQKWVSKLCETGGRAWTLSVPVNFDRDPDMLITELCKRYAALLARHTALREEGSMSEKWMPGPWEIDEENTCLSVRVSGNIKPGARWRVATVGSVGRSKSDEQNMATAHLIAAAPDLYKSLERIYGKLLMSDRDGDARITEEDGAMAESALKKARGEE